MNSGFVPVTIDQFGGLCTLIDRSDLPVGLSPNCVNVEFFPGGYKSRVGYVAVATDASGYVNGIGSFMTAAGTRQRLYLYSNGTLKYATGSPPETQTSIDTLLQNGMLMKTTALFNRIYMAFSGVTGGVYQPLAHARQWDGTNFDPVTQDGVPAYPTFNVDATGAGTSCTAGLHYLTMVCETRNGALCQPAQSGSSATITITNATDRYKLGTGGVNSIPLGPPNTVRRRFYITPKVVGGDATQFYTLPKLWINNNTDDAGPVYFDVSDTELQAGEPLTGNTFKNIPNLTNVIPIPPVLSIGNYSNRLILMGPLNTVPRQVIPITKDPNGNNVIIGEILGFANGMFTGGSNTGGNPYGWSIAGSAGGALATVPGATVQCWEITCDGATYAATPYRGEIRNTYTGTRLAGDYVGGAVYNYRVRLKKTSGFTGNFIIGLVGVSSTTIAAASLTTDWAWYTGQLFSATTTGQLYVGVSGATTNTEKLRIDAVEVYSSAYPILYARAHVSCRYSPEAFDLTTGIIDVNPGDGQGLRDGFEMGGSYYWVKERSLWRSNDNGLEPTYWDGPDLISPVCGSPSVNGVGIGVRWVIICGEQGVFKFDGGEPEPISDEIRPTWQRVNWDYGHLIWCVVDPENLRVNIGIPLDSSTTVNAMLTLDYSQGWHNAMSSPGTGRKWTLQVGTAVAGFVCGARVERDNGRRNVVFGGGVSGSQGFVVRQDPTGAAIVDNFGYGNSTLTSTYETATVGAEIGRSFFGVIVTKAGGSGLLQPYIVRPGGATTTLAKAGLSSSSNHDVEFKSKNATDTQIGVRFVVGATDATGSGQGNIRVKRIAIGRKDATYSKLRGKNTP